jgi:hypothetical protein
MSNLVRAMMIGSLLIPVAFSVSAEDTAAVGETVKQEQVENKDAKASEGMGQTAASTEKKAEAKHHGKHHRKHHGKKHHAKKHHVEVKKEEKKDVK